MGSTSVIKPLLQQAHLLTRQYDAVVANPPYMGGKYFAGRLRDFAAKQYKEAKADLYACFIQRNVIFAKPSGFIGMITIPNWMFLSSFEQVRRSLFSNQTIDSFIHNGRGVFGSDFGSCSFTIWNFPLATFRGCFRKLFDKQGSVSSNEELEARFLRERDYHATSNEFTALPGCPLAFWVSDKLRKAFSRFPLLHTIADVRQGLATADDDRFLRYWHEVDHRNVGWHGHDADAKWFPFNKGGPFRRWYGNNEYVVNWKDNGREILGYVDSNGRQRSRPQNRDYYFKDGITWSLISISRPSFRLFDSSFIFGHKGPGVFCERDMIGILAFLNSKVAAEMLRVLSPTVGFEIGQIQQLPICNVMPTESLAREAVELHRLDWDAFETSWAFQTLPVVRFRSPDVFCASQEASDKEHYGRFCKAKELESRINALFIEAYGLQDELTSDADDDQITLYRPDRLEDIKRLLSYAIGCMMGRYSLDKPGLIYAHSGNAGFDPSQYKTFPADDDGIIPLLETDWGFRDDAANRIVEFIGVAWPKEHLEENLKFIADSLGPNQRRATPRHDPPLPGHGVLQGPPAMYKRRPIYWLFSSGKQRAFQCLVYLHRYHEGTLARMRTEYVIPLQGKIAARIEQLEGDKTKATRQLAPQEAAEGTGRPQEAADRTVRLR